jgi:hypothetical protein
MSSRKRSNIKGRFIKECEDINQYVQLIVETAKKRSWNSVYYHYDVMKYFQLTDADHKEDVYRLQYENNPVEYANYLNSLIDPIKILLDTFKRLRSSEEKLKEHSKASRSTSDRAVNWCFEGFFDVEKPVITILMDNDNLHKFIDSEIDSFLNLVRFEDGTTPYDSEELEKITKSVDYEYIYANCSEKIFISIINELRSLLDFINTFSIQLRMNEQESILNNFRQGFILIVACFDATVFDITEEILKDQFFKYISRFNSGSMPITIKLKELNDFADFETFRDDLIGKSLKGKYVKDLIEIYKTLEVPYIKANFPKLIECMNRRNVHLHNNGYADNKYINIYNIYDYNIDDALTIDEAYFVECCEFCSMTVNSICEHFSDILS